LQKSHAALVEIGSHNLVSLGILSKLLKFFNLLGQDIVLFEASVGVAPGKRVLRGL
jgi:hypothetical protein